MSRFIRRALIVAMLALATVTVSNAMVYSTAVAANECEGGDCRK